MNESTWKRMSSGDRMNWLIEELRWGRFEFFDLLDLRPEWNGSIINLPQGLRAEQAVVIALKAVSHHQER
jgi:hypothetical protein